MSYQNIRYFQLEYCELMFWQSFSDDGGKWMEYLISDKLLWRKASFIYPLTNPRLAFNGFLFEPKCLNGEQMLHFSKSGKRWLSNYLESNVDIVCWADISPACHSFIDLTLKNVLWLFQQTQLFHLTVLVDDFEEPLGCYLLRLSWDEPRC